MIESPANRARGDPSRQVKRKTLKARNSKHEKCITSHSFVFSHSRSLKLRKSHGSRARKLLDSATGPWLNLSRSSGGSGSKTSSSNHIMCNVGSEDWLVQNFEPNTDCGFANCQTQHRASLMHQPAKVTQTISVMEPSWIETITVTNCSKQVHQSQHRRGLKDQTKWAETLVGAFTTFVGSNRLSRVVVAGVMSLTTAATCPSSQPWFFRFIRWRKEAIHLPRNLRISQARRQSQSRLGKGVLALAAVRHDESSPLIPPQEKDANQCQRPSKSKPGIGRPIAFPSSHQEFTSHRTRRVRFGRLLLDAKREQQNASWSSGRNESQNP